MLVVDFMNVLVRCYHAGGGQPSKVHAVRGMLDSVRKVCQTLNPSVIVFAGEGGHGYRKSLHPGYKSSRDETPPELRDQIELAKQSLEAIGWPLLSSPGAEADDVIATLATDLRGRADSVVVLSTDKDLQQLIGTGCQIYDPYNRKGFVRAEHVIEKFGVQPSQLGDLLALAGDKSDDVPGVQGIGPKKAAGLLIEFQTLDRILEAAKDWSDDKSKMRRTLAASIDAARLSRQLVELQSNVPIVHGWEDWPADNPRNLWIDKLRDLGLGAAATRLGDWLKEPRRTETTLSELTTRKAPDASDDLSDDIATDCRRGEQTHSVDSGDVDYQPVASERNVPAARIETAAQPDGKERDGRSEQAGRVDQPTNGSDSRLTADHVCSNGRTAGVMYADGQAWAKRETELAAKARRGELTAIGCWGKDGGTTDWAIVFWRGALNEPLEGKPAADAANQGGLF